MRAKQVVLGCLQVLEDFVQKDLKFWPEYFCDILTGNYKKWPKIMCKRFVWKM